MFQVHRVLEATYYLLGVLAMVSFSVIIFCSAIKNWPIFAVQKEGDRCIQTK